MTQRSFTEQRAETNAFVDALIAKYNELKPSHPVSTNICIDLPDYPSDELMTRVVNELNKRGWGAEPVEFRASSGRAGAIWLDSRK